MKNIGPNVNRRIFSYQQPSQGYGDNQRLDELQPKEKGAEVTTGKPLSILSGRTADQIDYTTGGSVDSLKPNGPNSDATKANTCQAAAYVEQGVCYDGVAITFKNTYSGPPIVILETGGLCYDSALSGDQSQRFRPTSITATGFVPDLKIVSGGTSTPTSQNFSPHNTYGASASLSLSSPAVDGSYTVNFTAKIVTVTDFDSVQVGVKMNGSTVWSRTIYGTNGKTATFSPTITDTSLSAGQTVEVLALSGNGQISADNMDYNTGTAPTTASATPSGVQGVSYTVYPPA